MLQHFSILEFGCHDGTPYPLDNIDEEDPARRTWSETRLTPLLNVLERLRFELGNRPIHILSGYRSPAHNAAIGGAKASQHMAGRAADITVDGVPPTNVHATLLYLFQHRAVEIGGIGIYPAWVHVDVRPRLPSGHLAHWTGVRIGDEAVT